MLTLADSVRPLLFAESLVASVRSIVVGKEFDDLTPKKATYVALSRLDGMLRDPLKTNVQELLRAHDIRCKFVPLNHQTDAHIAIELKDMYESRNILQRAGYETEIDVPHHVWKRIKEDQEFQYDIPEDIEERLGSELWTKVLRPFQKTAVVKAIRRKKYLIYDEMGCGKTLEGLAVAKYYESLWPVLVVCPSYLTPNWKREAIRWLGLEEKDVWRIRASKDFTLKKNQGRAYKFMFISYALVSKPSIREKLEKLFKVVIFDESQYIKGIKSKRAYHSVRLAQQAEVRLLLSGTPGNYLCDFYQQIKAVDSDIYPTFFNERSGKEPDGETWFGSRYCKPTKIKFQRTFTWMYHGYDHQEELNALLNTMMVRRRKKQVLSQLPDKLRSSLELPELPAKQQKEIDKLLKEEEKESDEPGGDPVKFMKSFRLTMEYKIPGVCEMIRLFVIRDLMKENPDMKVLIFMYHNLMREALEELFTKEKIPYFMINGQTKNSKRDEYQHDFQTTDKYRAGILSIQAAGAGLTLTKANVVVFTEILFGADSMMQAEDRVHRISQEKECHIIYLVQPKTVDDINWNLIKKKERESSLALDGQMSFISNRRIKITDDNFTSLNNTLLQHREENAERKRKIHSGISEQKTQPPKRRMVSSRRKKREDDSLHHSSDEMQALMNQNIDF